MGLKSPDVAGLKTPDVAVSVEGVSFSYADHTALEHVNFTVGTGEIVGLLGHNGAGKTTTIRLLNGLLEPTSGSIEVFGLNPLTAGAALRSQTSVVSDSLGLAERQTARQAMVYHASLWELDRADAAAFAEHLLQRFGLGAVIDTSIKTFSRGMRQRLALARSLLHRPRLLLLDEPTLGMDPVGRKNFRDILEELRAEGTSVLMSTHDLGEVERVCQRVVILHTGKVLLQGTPAECVAPLQKDLAVEVELNEPASQMHTDALVGLPGVDGVRASGTRLTFVADSRLSVGTAISAISGAGGSIVSVHSDAPTLEDVYLNMHGTDQVGGQR